MRSSLLTTCCLLFSAVTCQYLVPLLLGTVRAFGRDTDPLVFPQLFPCASDTLSTMPLTSPNDKKRRLTNSIELPSYFFSEASI